MSDDKDCISDTSSVVSEKSISGYEKEEKPEVKTEVAAAKAESAKADSASESNSELNESLKSAEPKVSDKSGRAGGPLANNDLPPLPDFQGQASGKSQHLGDKLGDYELNLYEYSTFSLMEEIDIHYCKFKNLEKFKKEYTDDDLRNEV